MDDDLRHSLMAGQRAGQRYALAAPSRAPVGVMGAQLANRAGSSLEFIDHREYQPGDDLRRINWNAYARSDKLTVKLYREEVTPHLDLVIDASRSMDLPGSDKARATVAMAAMLAAAAENSGFSHRLWMAAEGFRPVDGGERDSRRWEGISFDYVGDVNQSYARLAPKWRPRGIRIIVSDLLWLGEPSVTLSRLAAEATAAVVVQLLARADTDPPARGNMRLADSESDAIMDVFVDATSQQRYRNSLSRHQDNWRRAAAQYGAIMTTVVAEDFIENWQVDELVAAEVLKVI